MTTAERAALARERIARFHAQHVPDVPDERPVEHVRNALQLIRLAIDTGEPMLGNGTPGIVVSIMIIARLQALLEVVLEQLDPPNVGCDLVLPEVRCLKCGGTILPPTIGGVPRGSCHCPK